MGAYYANQLNFSNDFPIKVGCVLYKCAYYNQIFTVPCLGTKYHGFGFGQFTGKNAVSVFKTNPTLPTTARVYNNGDNNQQIWYLD